jgi:hypothetical protein
MSLGSSRLNLRRFFFAEPSRSNRPGSDARPGIKIMTYADALVCERSGDAGYVGRTILWSYA